MQLLQYVRNLYNRRFRTASNSDLDDGPPSPQSTKYSVWPPISWDSAHIILYHTV